MILCNTLDMNRMGRDRFERNMCQEMKEKTGLDPISIVVKDKILQPSVEICISPTL